MGSVLRKRPIGIQMTWSQLLASDRWIFVLSVVFSLLLYGGTLNNGYSIDDYLVAENLEMVNQGVSGIPEILTTYYGETDLGNPFEYRPITRITFALERSLWGEILWVSHFINILMYALLVFVVFQFFLSLMGSQYKTLLLLTSFLFLFHPIHSEVVCSLKNRDEILSLLLAFCSGMLLIKFVKKKSALLMIGSSLLFILSLATKPGQLPLVGVIVLGLLLFQKRPLKDLIWAGLPFFILTASYLATVIHFFPQWWRLDYAYEENSLDFLSGFSERLPTAFVALTHNIRMLIWPHPLSFFYGHDHISVAQWSDGIVWIGVGALVVLTLGFFGLIKKHPIVSFGIGIFIMSVSPFLNVIGAVAGIVAERWLLAASIGFCLILAYLLLGLLQSSKLRLAGVSLILLLLVLSSVRIISRIPDWKSSRTLVYKDVETVPRSFVPNFLAARFYLEDSELADDPDEKERLLRLSFRSNEMLVDICIKKARFLRRCTEQSLQLGENGKAVGYAMRLFEEGGNKLDHSVAAMQTLLTLSEAQNGLNVSKQASYIHPGRFQPLVYQGNFYLMLGDTAKAIDVYQIAMNTQDAQPRIQDYIDQLKKAYSVE